MPPSTANTAPLPAAPWFNPRPRIHTVALPQGVCVVIDDVLNDPEAWRQWAATQRFKEPDYPYPGLILEAPLALTERMADCFAEHGRAALNGRRTLGMQLRFSVVSTPPDQLKPCQWICHRDQFGVKPGELFAASVLYLFHDESLGGTSFYAPRQAPEPTDRMIVDSMLLDNAAFSARYGLKAGYMGDGNAYFERVARVPAAWNRMIVYDGNVFHSADLGPPERLVHDPLAGRLTLNAFFTCKRGLT